LSVTVHLPAPLRPFASGQSTLPLTGAATVAEALALVPAGVRERILDERGELRLHVNVFVGETSVRETGGLETPLRDGAEVFVIPAISGG
jgi:molybdopterin converting factor small subunit